MMLFDNSGGAGAGGGGGGLPALLQALLGMNGGAANGAGSLGGASMTGNAMEDEEEAKKRAVGMPGSTPFGSQQGSMGMWQALLGSMPTLGLGSQGGSMTMPGSMGTRRPAMQFDGGNSRMGQPMGMMPLLAALIGGGRGR